MLVQLAISQRFTLIDRCQPTALRIFYLAFEPHARGVDHHVIIRER
jgi:hypothetical protein